MKLISFILAIILLHTPALADPPSSLPQDLGVRIEKPAGDGTHYVQGSGVYIGNALVLTAAHVVAANPSSVDVTVLLDGRRTPGVVVARGHGTEEDLALIRLTKEAVAKERLNAPPIAVCPANPGPSEPVRVASLGKVTTAFTIPKPFTADGRDTGSWTNLLAGGAQPGQSGGGVFSLRQKCLWGILTTAMGGTAKTDGKPIELTAFVPAQAISAFLAKNHDDLSVRP